MDSKNKTHKPRQRGHDMTKAFYGEPHPFIKRTITQRRYRRMERHALEQRVASLGKRLRIADCKWSSIWREVKKMMMYEVLTIQFWWAELILQKSCNKYCSGWSVPSQQREMPRR